MRITLFCHVKLKDWVSIALIRRRNIVFKLPYLTETQPQQQVSWKFEKMYGQVVCAMYIVCKILTTTNCDLFKLLNKLDFKYSNNFMERLQLNRVRVERKFTLTCFWAHILPIFQPKFRFPLTSQRSWVSTLLQELVSSFENIAHNAHN